MGSREVKEVKRVKDCFLLGFLSLREQIVFSVPTIHFWNSYYEVSGTPHPHFIHSAIHTPCMILNQFAKKG